MFGKKVQPDVKKSTQKFLDVKKDTSTRIKHLRIVIDNLEKEEVPVFFNTHHKLIHSLVNDGISVAETNLKQRVHKAAREELDQALAVLEQLLIHVPDLIQRGWQQHSFLHTLTKLLNPANSIRLRKDAIRFFIIWYQTLGDSATKEVDAVFATIVPGFSTPYPGLGLPPAALGIPAHRAVFHDNVTGAAMDQQQPLLLPQSGDKPIDDPSYFFLDILLNTMASQVGRVEWKEKLCASFRSLSFLLERFKKFYLHQIFPDWCNETSLYPPVLDLPETCRKSFADEVKDPFVSCRVCVIKWVISFTHVNKKDPPRTSPATSITQDIEQSSNPRISTVSTPVGTVDLQEDLTAATMREVLYSSRENVNFILEVYRQAFMLPFNHAVAIRRAITAYKDWIQLNGPELPPFLLEPLEGDPNSEEARIRLRTDSYLGAVSRDHFLIRAGLQSTLQLFISHAANVFLVNTRNNALLEEQVDTCKRVLNIYRFMVMQTKMELSTWEQLLMVLLRITSLVLNRVPPKRKEETLGGKLAQAIFQTLIVTWIKANLNVVISLSLWDQFQSVLTSLTQWEELIREWAKTLETLTRVLARHVYGLDLNDLPLDRLSEQQAKKQRKGIRLADSHLDGPQAPQKRMGGLRTQNLNSNSNNHRVPTMHGNHETPSITSESSGSFPQRRRTVSLGDQNQLANSRSFSDSNLACNIRRSSGRSHRRSRHRGALEGKPNRMRKSRSVDAIIVRQEMESAPATRSPSPAPSSGIESSIKDSPLALDFVTADATSLDSTDGRESRSDERDGKSVMSGGCVRGWLPDVAVVLWRRMLGALGNINRLPDPYLHAKVFEYLVELWDTLARIAANQGVPEDGVTTASTNLTPPLTIFAPWCFKALELPDSYQRGKLIAYKLICRMVLGISPIYLDTNFLAHTYKSLHSALAGPSPQIVCTVLKCLGSRFISRQLPGYSLLLLDLISAANSILESSDLETTPRVEAASVLGSVLTLPYMVSQAPNLDPRETSIEILNCAGAKDLVVGSLLRAAKHEQSGSARCTILSSLSIFIYTEMTNASPHPAVPNALHLILLALKFRQRAVGILACDLLFSLADHVDKINETFPGLAERVILTTAHVLASFGPNNHGGPLGPALAFILGEWTMRMPLKGLLVKNPKPILLIVLTVLTDVAKGRNSTESVPVDFSEELLNEWENSIKLDDLGSVKHSAEKGNTVLASRAVLMHLVSHLGHFPLGLGAARLSSLVQEHDDVPELGNELSPKIFSASNVQMMMVRHSLMSLIEVEHILSPGGGVTAGLITGNHQSRVLLRDLTNKASWDGSQVYCSPQDLPSARRIPQINMLNSYNLDHGNDMTTTQPLMSLFVTPPGGSIGINPPMGMLRHRPPHLLPDHTNAAPDMDNLHDLLRYIGYTSPECLHDPETELCEPCPTPAPFTKQVESDVISAVLAQRTMETDYSRNCREHVNECRPPINQSVPVPFQHCRALVSQLGLTGWDRRAQVHLLSRSDQLLRELRNLDTKLERETHKIAVIYVASGQEDKTSILSNHGGSQAYEQFVSALAWEVELATHTGFIGRLGSGCGDTALYYASAFIEVLFHVATRMPSNTDEALLQKMKHLGNDEVHVVWSEHYRDYRRSSLPTEFCDVLIIIYPLPDSLFRVTIDTKTEMTLFGPLWNECVVEARALPGLVRATVVAASRAIRRTLQNYRAFYEERELSLSTVVSSLKEPKSFEDFISSVFCPGVTANKGSETKNFTTDRCSEKSSSSPVQSKRPTFRSESTSPHLPRSK